MELFEAALILLSVGVVKWWVILMKRIKAPKLLFVTDAVDKVLYLDLWARNCSFKFHLYCNIQYCLCNWETYLEPLQTCIIELCKGSKYVSTAVSLSCIVIKKTWGSAIPITICSKIFQQIFLRETYTWSPKTLTKTN